MESRGAGLPSSIAFYHDLSGAHLSPPLTEEFVKNNLSSVLSWREHGSKQKESRPVTESKNGREAVLSPKSSGRACSIEVSVLRHGGDIE